MQARSDAHHRKCPDMRSVAQISQLPVYNQIVVGTTHSATVICRQANSVYTPRDFPLFELKTSMGLSFGLTADQWFLHLSPNVYLHTPTHLAAVKSTTNYKSVQNTPVSASVNVFMCMCLCVGDSVCQLYIVCVFFFSCFFFLFFFSDYYYIYIVCVVVFAVVRHSSSFVRATCLKKLYWLPPSLHRFAAWRFCLCVWRTSGEQARPDCMPAVLFIYFFCSSNGWMDFDEVFYKWSDRYLRGPIISDFENSISMTSWRPFCTFLLGHSQGRNFALIFFKIGE